MVPLGAVTPPSADQDGAKFILLSIKSSSLCFEGTRRVELEDSPPMGLITQNVPRSFKVAVRRMRLSPSRWASVSRTARLPQRFYREVPLRHTAATQTPHFKRKCLLRTQKAPKAPLWFGGQPRTRPQVFRSVWGQGCDLLAATWCQTRSERNPFVLF